MWRKTYCPGNALLLSMAYETEQLERKANDLQKFIDRG